MEERNRGEVRERQLCDSECRQCRGYVISPGHAGAVMKHTREAREKSKQKTMGVSYTSFPPIREEKL